MSLGRTLQALKNVEVEAAILSARHCNYCPLGGGKEGHGCGRCYQFL